MSKLTITYFTPSSSVSIVNFEQENADWVVMDRFQISILILANLYDLINFYIPLKSLENHKYSDDLRGNRYWLTQLLILEEKFGDNP